MPEARTGRRLVLESTIFYQLISDATLFDHLPPSFAGLKSQTEAACRAALASVMGETCSGCSSLNAILRPTMNAFGQLLETTPRDELERFIAHVAKRRGSRPSSIVLHYQDTEERLKTVTL